MVRSGLAIAVACGLATPAAALSPDAERLARAQVVGACGAAGGSISADGVIERDLTGDGAADLIISHEAIRCDGTGRSPSCGMQVCAVHVYVRRGDRLQHVLETLAMGVRVGAGAGAVPVIHGYSHGGAPRTLRWDGSNRRFVHD